jgi:hypothetical protein
MAAANIFDTNVLRNDAMANRTPRRGCVVFLLAEGKEPANLSPMRRQQPAAPWSSASPAVHGARRSTSRTRMGDPRSSISAGRLMGWFGVSGKDRATTARRAVQLGRAYPPALRVDSHRLAASSGRSRTIRRGSVIMDAR